MKKIKYFTMLIGASSAIFGGAFTGVMIDGQMLRNPIQIKNESFENELLAFAQISAMAEVAQEVTEHITTGFELGSVSIDPSPENSASGDEFLLSVVDKCSIHSEDDFDPMCFICKLSDSDGNLLAQGIIGESFDKVYVGSSTITIDLKSDPSNQYSNQVEKVQNVEVSICGPLDDFEPLSIAIEDVAP